MTAPPEEGPAFDPHSVVGLHAQIASLSRRVELLDSLNVDKVGADLVDAIESAVRVVKFAMSRMSPQEIHAWPVGDLEQFAERVRALPHRDLGASLDHDSWTLDALQFAREARDYDRRRARFEVVNALDEIPRGLSLLYVAHPVAGDPIGNCLRAKRWIRWLMEEDTRHTFAAPWLANVEAVAPSPADEARHRERGMRDNRISLLRYDGIVLVGGRLTKGMAWEKSVMRELGRPCIDLLHLGPEPPTP